MQRCYRILIGGMRQMQDDPEEFDDFLDNYEDEEDPWSEDRDERSFHERRLAMIEDAVNRLREKD